MEPLDIVDLDRSLARATKRVRQFLRRLRTDGPLAEDESWYASDRHTSTRSTFVAVSQLASEDPWRENLRRWVYALTLTRVAEPYFVRVAAARHARELRFEAPEPGMFSVREVTHRLLAERSADKRASWMHSLAAAKEATRTVRTAEHALADALREIDSRLGEASTATPLRLPFATSVAASLARSLLDRTHDLADHCFASQGTFGNVLHLFVANQVPGVWPARPDARWLIEAVGMPALVEGLELDLGPLPRAMGASSFARALCRFGSAYARAAAPRQAAFALAQDPTLLHPYRRGALFGSLLADPAFLKSRLGFSRDAARAVAHAVAISFLGAARLEAERTLVDFATASATDIEGSLEEAFRVPYPRPLARVLPKPCRQAPVRLAAMLLAARDRRELVEEFDEDWFRNPKALSHLRDLDSLPPRTQFDEAAFTEAAAQWSSAITELAS